MMRLRELLEKLKNAVWPTSVSVYHVGHTADNCPRLSSKPSGLSRKSPLSMELTLRSPRPLRPVKASSRRNGTTSMRKTRITTPPTALDRLRLVPGPVPEYAWDEIRLEPITKRSKWRPSYSCLKPAAPGRGTPTVRPAGVNESESTAS